MKLWSRLPAAAHRVRRPKAWERGLEDEPQSYLVREIDARMRAAMSESEARRTALAEFGGVEQVREPVDSVEYHGIHEIDALAFGRAVALFVAAMLLASAVPAVRASRLDPADNLKDG